MSQSHTSHFCFGHLAWQGGTCLYHQTVNRQAGMVKDQAGHRMDGEGGGWMARPHVEKTPSTHSPESQGCPCDLMNAFYSLACTGECGLVWVWARRRQGSHPCVLFHLGHIFSSYLMTRPIFAASQHGKWPPKGQSIDHFPFRSEVPSNPLVAWSLLYKGYRMLANTLHFLSLDPQDCSAGQGKHTTRTRNQGGGIA